MLGLTACPDYSGKSRLAGKTLIQTLFFFLLVTQICFGQWELQNPLITQKTLNDVTLIDENLGWAVGDSGTIIKTTDGGLDWSMQESNIEYSLRGVSFVDSNNGWAGGENGTILKTSDGGTNWIIQNSGVTDNLNDISFVDLNNGLVVGENGIILRTINGGSNWLAQTIGATISLYGVYLVDINNGWIVGDNSVTGNPYGIIKRTTDGGTTWTAQSSPFNIQESLYDVTFIDINTGWIVGRNHDGTNPWGEILKTTNGGSTWIAQNCPTQAELSSVYFIDQNNGWATAADRWYGIIKGHILKTTNGGATWLMHYLGISKPTNGIFFKNSNNGIAVGENGTIQLSTDGGDMWNSPLGGSTNNWTGLNFSDPNNGLVIGDAGAILKTTNGGTSWMLAQTGFTNDLSSMCFTDANNGWIIGHGENPNVDTSIILHTNDGGESWAVKLSYPGTISGISFIDTSLGYLAGYDLNGPYWPYVFILRTTDGGMSWTQSIFDSLNVPKQIQFLDINNGWMTWELTGSGPGGPWGGMVKTTDGGNSWVQQLGAHYNDFQFRDVNNGIAVARRHINNVKSAYSMEDAEWGIISKTTDGGETWSSDSIYTPAFDVHYINNNTIVTLGKRSDDQVICYWSADAGSTWNPRPTGIYEDVHHIFFIDEQNGWMIGNNGAIYHTANGGVSFVEEEQINEMPTEFLLSQNYPNPFNPSTRIKYQVSSVSHVSLVVYDILGNEIETLVSEEKAVGTYELTWNAATLPSGVYFYQLRAGEYTAVKKMLLLK